jgi:hypothetical protein
MGNLFKSCLGDLPEDEVENLVYIPCIVELSHQEVSTVAEIYIIETASPPNVDMVNSTESFKLDEERKRLQDISDPFRLAGGKYQRSFHDNVLKTTTSFYSVIVELLLGTGLLISVLIINQILSALWINATILQLYVQFSPPYLWASGSSDENNSGYDANSTTVVVPLPSESEGSVLHNFESFFGTFG